MPPTIPVSRAEQSTGCVILMVIHDPVWEVVVVTGLPILSAQDSILHRSDLLHNEARFALIPFQELPAEPCRCLD
jgi:hypothetical protein